jgi:hypothetical protein
MSNRIERPQPPALPQPPAGYDRRYTDQLNNVLRLFFRRLTATVNELLSTEDGGRYLYMPRGLFYSTADQTAAATNTGYPVELETTYLGNGVTIGGTNDTRVTVSADGVYNFQFSLQLEHTGGSACALWVWINKNGTDVPYGAHRYTIKGNDYFAVNWNFSIDLTAGQYVEMYWATDDTGLTIHSEAPTAPHPGVPAAVMAVSFVSNL